MSTIKLAFCDIDGVIAILPKLTTAEYFESDAQLSQCRVTPCAAAILSKLHVGKFKMCFLTGRSEERWAVTMNWLIIQLKVPTAWELVTRGKALPQFRHLIKQQHIMNAIVAAVWHPDDELHVVVVDDDEGTLKALRLLFKCYLQVSPVKLYYELYKVENNRRVVCFDSNNVSLQTLEHL